MRNNSAAAEILYIKLELDQINLAVSCVITTLALKQAMPSRSLESCNQHLVDTDLQR